MLQVARLAPNLLREATERVDDFLRNQINPDGGFRDRAGRSDLYYTVFGLEGLIALRQEPPYSRVRSYLEQFGDGEGLDLVHLACLARCWAALPFGSLSPAIARRLAKRLDAFRAGDGGYGPTPGTPAGTVYHGFLVLGAHQDLGIPVPDAKGLATSVQSLQLESGAFSGRPGLPAPSTPNTAAALTLLRQLGSPARPGGSDWLLRQACRDGGFRAGEDTPVPDLLSTATALHALAGMQISFQHLKEPTLDFLDTLWTSRGAFFGNWTDDVADCEYTWYALLALGHLSL
jgi:prenyltransferase beta subunit